MLNRRVLMLNKAKKKIVESAEEEELLDNMSDEEIEALADQLEDDTADETVQEAISQDDVDGTAGMDSKFKTNRMSVAMHALAGMSGDQIDFFLKSLEQVGHEADLVPGGSSAKNQSSIAMKGDAKSAKLMEALKSTLKEDLATVFGDSKELSEEFKEKITTLFEAAVSYRVTALEQTLREEYEEKFEEEVSELTEGLIEKVDEYVSYVAEEWVKENKVAVTNSLTVESAEEFLKGIKELMIAHNIEIPQEKVDVVDAQHQKIENMEEQINKLMEDNMVLVEHVKEIDREKLVSEFATGMTLSQTEKFKQLTESIDYDGDDEEFNKKLEIIKENHFKGVVSPKKSSTNIITEEITYSPNVIEEEARAAEDEKINTLDPEMKHLVYGLKRTLKL
jgi:hypothetical protein